MLAEYNALEKKYEEVIKEKDKLLKKLEALENLETKKIHTNDQVCQTKPDSKYVEISCTECIFFASSEDELNWHRRINNIQNISGFQINLIVCHDAR